MSDMMWIVGLGALAIGGWCFLAGPCKGMLNSKKDTGNGIGDYTLEDIKRILPSQEEQLKRYLGPSSNYTRLAI
jgi:hypothetical protein